MRPRTILLLAATACSSGQLGPDPGAPPGADTAEPFPIDRGDAPGTPGTYKGLPLRLTEGGAPSVTPVDGVIGVVCIGMSNAAQECGNFVARARGEWAGVISPAVRIANCAVGGHAIERWNDPAYDAVLWDDCRSRRLPASGIRPDQVRALYHKAANQFTTGPGGAALPPYPQSGSDFEAFRANLSAFAARVSTKFPSAQAVYTTSRSYGGFANSPARGEPLSYEEGHALNAWLATNGRVDGIWYGWGPYIWAPDCAEGTTSGAGICYERSDFVADGVHPSATGEFKIGTLIHQRLLREGWYRR